MRLIDGAHGALIRTAFAGWYGWRPYGRYAAFLDRSQWWSADRVADWQRDRLASLLRHAYDNVPLYREWFEALGLTPNELRLPEDMAKLPLLTKRDIQRRAADLLAQGSRRSDLTENHTGGSTGEPLTFFQDANFEAWSEADKLRCYRLAGYELGARWAFLWGSDFDGRTHKGRRGQFIDKLIYNLKWINTFDLNVETLAVAAQQLAAWQPQVLVAYVSSATLLARLIQTRGLKPIRPQTIQTSAEVLTADDRQLLEDVFGCRVFDRYGCREVNNIAHECEAHQGLHILAENNLIELVDGQGRPVEPGQIGRVVVTNLNNRAMPLIRYEIGDLARAATTPCVCGRGLPLLTDIIGRTADVITSPSGKLLHGEFFTHLFYKITGIQQFRVVQDTRADLRIQLVAGPRANETEIMNFLSETIQRHGDPAFRVQFEWHTQLPAASSGKFRFTVSNVPADLGKGDA